MKKLKVIIAIVVILILLITGIITGITLYSNDKIISTEEKVIDKTMLILHKTESGSEISLPVLMECTEVAEGEYRLKIFFSENDNTENYEVENLKLSLRLSEDLEITSRYCEWGKDDNKGSDITGKDGPDVSAENGIKTLKYETKSNYMLLELTVSGETDESMILDLQYDISGKGIYIFNHFKDISHKFEIALQE